ELIKEIETVLVGDNGNIQCFSNGDFSVDNILQVIDASDNLGRGVCSVKSVQNHGVTSSHATFCEPLLNISKNLRSVLCHLIGEFQDVTVLLNGILNLFKSWLRCIG